MPFTLSHPVLVLPVRMILRWLPWSALAIGAMIPDIAYFIALRPTGTLGHTIYGVFIQGLPAGLLLFVLWHHLMRPALLAIAPQMIASRLNHTPKRISWPAVVAAIIIGALSHIAWDSMTHATGWVVQSWPLWTTHVGPLPLYRWHQYLGGAVGLVILAGYAVSWLHQTPPTDTPSTMSPGKKVIAWAGIAMTSILFITLATWPLDGSVHALIVKAIIGSISGAWVGVLGFAVGWRLCVVRS